MSVSQYLILVAVFFVTSAVGVVTGSNSLITVPVMFEMGIEPKRAIATNMFGLTFMALGATIQFHRKGMIDTKGLTPLAILTLAGSAIGAALVGVVSSSWIPTIVSVSMVAVGLFTLLKSNTGLESKSAEVGRGRMLFTLLLGFLLAIYGGFYSGGYMTVLTAVLVAFAGMSFSEAIAGTKYLNLFSSSIATALFMWQGLVDYKLGAILAVTMFIAAWVGARTVVGMDEKWLKRIFLVVVFVLALKVLFF